MSSTNENLKDIMFEEICSQNKGNINWPKLYEAIKNAYIPVYAVYDDDDLESYKIIFGNGELRKLIERLIREGGMNDDLRGEFYAKYGSVLSVGNVIFSDFDDMSSVLNHQKNIYLEDERLNLFGTYKIYRIDTHI